MRSWTDEHELTDKQLAKIAERTAEENDNRRYALQQIVAMTNFALRHGDLGGLRSTFRQINAVARMGCAGLRDAEGADPVAAIAHELVPPTIGSGGVGDYNAQIDEDREKLKEPTR